MVEVFVDITHCNFTFIESQFVLFIDACILEIFDFHVSFSDEPNALFFLSRLTNLLLS
jgi:hypothetical protein